MIAQEPPYLRSTWNPSDDELDVFAARHICYEVCVLKRQLDALLPREKARLRGGPTDCIYDSLLEAVLVHLRLLDEFLGSKQQAYEEPWGEKDRKTETAFARHWITEWEPSRVLEPPERGWVNAQVAHLSGNRKDGRNYPLPEMARRCFEQLEVFYAALPPLRLPAFAEARDCGQAFLRDVPRYKDLQSSTTTDSLLTTLTVNAPEGIRRRLGRPRRSFNS